MIKNTLLKILPENSKLAEDIRRFDRTNTDERAVLESSFISYYKGKLVFRTNMKRSGSFGLLFISRRENKGRHPEDIVRHEYGHTVQLKKLGLFKYFFCIMLPSWRMWGSGKYYDKPWEAAADYFGGVKSRKPSTLVIKTGLDYLDESKKKGLAVLKKARNGNYEYKEK